MVTDIPIGYVNGKTLPSGHDIDGSDRFSTSHQQDRHIEEGTKTKLRSNNWH